MSTPAPLLAVSWFLLYVFSLGSFLVLLAWMEYAFAGSLTPAAASEVPDIRETISILTLFVLIALFWRSALCLKSDVCLAIRRRGGSFEISGRKGVGKLWGVAIKIDFDRPFLDYWPHPRGTQKEIIFGEEVRMPVGSYNPGYMKKMSTIELCLKCDAYENVRLSSKKYDERCCDTWQELIKEFDRVFGNALGDWEFKLTDGLMEMKVKGGSWEGNVFVSKIDWAVAKLRDLCEKYSIESRE